MKDVINDYCRMIHAENRRWWQDPKTGDYQGNQPFFAPAKMMLIVSEISEAVEGHRKNLMDDKLPHRPMVEVELADAIIRIFDLAGGYGMDLGGAIVEKLAYNRKREDHTNEARQAAGGKTY